MALFDAEYHADPYPEHRRLREQAPAHKVTMPDGQTAWIVTRAVDPDRFDSSRPAQHFTFGHGPHYCLGAPLARLETRIALETLFGRYLDLRIAVPVEDLPWRSSFRSHALKSLPVLLG